MLFGIITTMIVSMLPIFEVRGGIPYGLAVAKLGIAPTLLIAVISNIMVIPLVFFFLDYFHIHFMRISIYSRIFGKFIERTKRKAHSHITKYGCLGLALFVAIPLPVTGAYTGTLAAWLFGMDRKKSIIAISAGVVIASIIITAAYFLVLAGYGYGINIFVNDQLLN